MKILEDILFFKSPMIEDFGKFSKLRFYSKGLMYFLVRNFEKSILTAVFEDLFLIFARSLLAKFILR